MNNTSQPTTGTEDAQKTPSDGWDSPMLHRNNVEDGVPPAPPAQEAATPPPVQAPKEIAPNSQKAPEIKKELEVTNRVSAMDALGGFSEDPQFKPIAMYLDTQLKDVDTTRAFGKALEYGNLDLIDSVYLTEKLGDKAPEVIQLARALFEGASAKATSEVASVYQQYGGKEVVDQAIKFFNERGDQAERIALGSLLDSGIKENISYAMKQIVQFSTQAGGVAAKSTVIPIGQPSAERGLSAEEYRDALRDLTLKRTRPSSPEFDKLAKARHLGVQQGL